jgi:hypothetical protein
MSVKVKVEVIPVDTSEIASAEVSLGDGTSVIRLESGSARADHTFELHEDQELTVIGRVNERMEMDRDQFATRRVPVSGREPPKQTAYDPERDPIEQQRRQRERARQGGSSPSAYIPPGQPNVGVIRPTGQQATQPQPPQVGVVTGQDTPPKQDATVTTNISDSQVQKPAGAATDPAPKADPAAAPDSAASKIGTTGPASETAAGGASSSKEVK